MEKKRLDIRIGETGQTPGETGISRSLPGPIGSSNPDLVSGTGTGPTMNFNVKFKTIEDYKVTEQVYQAALDIAEDAGLAAADTLASSTAIGGGLGLVTGLVTGGVVLPLMLIGVGGGMLLDPNHPWSVVH